MPRLYACVRCFNICQQDAIGQYDTIMQGNPDHQTGFNLVLCHYALEDGLSMKKAFQRLAAIPVQVILLSIMCFDLRFAERFRKGQFRDPDRTHQPQANVRILF